MLAVARSVGRCAKPSKWIGNTKLSTTPPPQKVSRAGVYSVLGTASLLAIGGAVYFWDDISSQITPLWSPKALEVKEPALLSPPISSLDEPRTIPSSPISLPLPLETHSPTEAAPVPIDTVSPQQLEDLLGSCKEHANTLVGDLQQNVENKISKFVTANIHTATQLEDIKRLIAVLEDRLEKVSIGSQENHNKEKQAFQELLAVQEIGFHARLEKAVQEERSKSQGKLEVSLHEAAQAFEATLRTKLEEERAILHGTYEAQYHQKYIDLDNQSKNQVSKSLGDFEAFLLAREHEVLAQHQRHHDEQLQTLQRYNNELGAANYALANSTKHLATSTKTHSLCVAIFGLGNALSAPHQVSFSTELAALRDVSQGDNAVETLLLPLSSLAASGVSTHTQLRDRFKAVAQSGRQVALVPEEGGIVGNIVAAVASRLIIPEKGLVDGDNAEALFAKAEYYLDKGDLGTAVDYMEKLRGMPATVAKDWILAAKDKITADQTLGALQAYAASIGVTGGYRA